MLNYFFILTGFLLAKFPTCISVIVSLSAVYIDANRRKGKGGRGTSCSPSKTFKKFGHKNAIKHKKIQYPIDFLKTRYSLKRI
jgi:hypothetical protein